VSSSAGFARVAIVGGGISGLATAYRLGTAPRNGISIDVAVLEESAHFGGKLASVEVGGLQLEAGADSFVTRKPQAVELCTELGLSEELVVPGTTGTFVLRDGNLIPFLKRQALGVPADRGELLKWPGMSKRGRRRAALDTLKAPSAPHKDVSIGKLVRSRLGDEALRVLVGPVLGGLSAGDPDRLSVDATFPELKAWAMGRGMIRGARHALKMREERGDDDTPASRAMFATVWGGLGRLITKLELRIGPERISTGDAVRSIRVADGGFTLDTENGVERFDAVVLSTPAFTSAALLSPLAPDASAALSEIPYASTAVVSLVYPEGTQSKLPDATGFVVPDGEADITASTWISSKWPRPEFGTRAVLRCYVGRAGAEELLAESDDSLIDRASSVIDRLLQLGRAKDARVTRWERAMPQYEVGHLDRVQRIRDSLPEGIFVTGSAYRGVGIADCVRQAGETAGDVHGYLEARRSERETVPWTS
jgi:protoporphyrinogen/coproporphyrinogen III oxidase